MGKNWKARKEDENRNTKTGKMSVYLSGTRLVCHLNLLLVLVPEFVQCKHPESMHQALICCTKAVGADVLPASYVAMREKRGRELDVDGWACRC